MQKRFDTHFFVVRAPERQIAACDGYETVDAEWLSPSKALKLGVSGERTIIFPTRLNLQLLAEAASADDCVARAKAREIVPRSEEHTSELKSLMRISYAVFCLKKKKKTRTKDSEYTEIRNTNIT